ncbi:MAG: HisA/HisF-related TIM barrel protein [Actinomycetota bacterium]|nr:HisA/HisF-related TIM barrel protein [Actinomycetota bacterium]MDA3025578.1 HisA/HisF-related TIM barrel protein [Actinomycetota bacterium]
MTLKIRVIPTLLWKGPGLVKGQMFRNDRRVGPILPAVNVYNRRDVDELILLDVNREPITTTNKLQRIQEVGAEVSVPLTIGGGIRTADDATLILRNGADKISLNSSNYVYLELISEIASRHGSQAVVASLDVRRISRNEWKCFSKSGSQQESGDLKSWGVKLAEAGAGEILFTSIDRDGTMKGYDLDAIHLLSSSVEIPVIASGGAGKLSDFPEAIEAGASAVAAASVFHFTQITPSEVRRALSDFGHPVRQTC